MSKALKTVGIVAGVVALAATGIGAFAAAGSALAATAGSVATYAGLAATIANIGAQTLAKPPSARGQINRRTIGANQPTSYLMGESYSAGAQVHDVGYGGTVSGTPNPYRFIAAEASGAGPIQGLIDTLVDFQSTSFSGTAAAGYYSGFLYRDFRLGASPDTALTPNWSGAPNWSTSHKMSGHAAVGWSLKFDKNGKKFASGVPALGAIWRGVKVYDPRLDSTYPGGSGGHRINDETTWTYSSNPALHALAYAYGRHQNGKRVFGPDLGVAAIVVPTTVAWANVCDANGWTVNGTIYEPGDSWNNLKLICEAGSAEPMFTGGLLSFRYDSPKASLDTIQLDDLADGDLMATAGQPWKGRLNTIVPRYRSSAHQWEYVAASQVQDATAVTTDGEEKSREDQWDLVTDATQVAQLAGYRLANTREAGPIVLSLKLRMMRYVAGSRLTLSSALAAALGLTTTTAVVAQRRVDIQAGTVELTLSTDSDAKHSFALGRTVTIPPAVTPTSSSDMDMIAGASGVDAITAAASTAAWSGIANDNGAKPADNATADLKLTGLTAAISVQANTIANISGTSTHEATAAGNMITGPCIISCDIVTDGDYTALKFDSSATTYDYATQLIYAVLERSSGNWRIFASGTVVASGTIATGLTGRMSLVWDEVKYRLLIASGGEVGSYAPATIRTWHYPKWAVYAPGTMRSVTADATTSADFAKTGGTTKPEPNADVTAIVQGQVALSVGADSTGAANAGQLPKNLQFKLLRGGVDVTSSATWAVAVKTGSIGASISGGALSLSAVSGSISPTSTIEVSATYAGITRKADILTVTRQDAAPPASSGGGGGSGGGSSGGTSTASTSTIAATTGSSYGSANAGPLSFTAGASGSASLAAPLEFYRAISATGVTGASGKWQYRAGTTGSWSDGATEIAASATASHSVDGEGYASDNPGSININQTLAGLTAGSAYQAQLLLRSSNSVGCNFSGTASATSS